MAFSFVVLVLSVYCIKENVIFSLPPRASISGDLLALSDFYWPRANGPVLVSIPARILETYA